MKLVGHLSLKDLKFAEKAIGGMAKEIIQKSIIKSLPRINIKVSLILETALESSDEWRSILSGRLREEFGLENPENAVLFIKNAIVGSLKTYSVNIPGSLGAIRVDILPLEVERQLADSLSYISHGKIGGKIDWLNWLLFSGTSIVVSDATFHLFNKQITASRTGHSLMIQKKPLGYSVNPEFSGDSSLNWFDKVLIPLGQPVLTIMIDEVKRNL